MKYSVTDLEEENEPIIFTNNILGNYFLKPYFGNFLTQLSRDLSAFFYSKTEIFS